MHSKLRLSTIIYASACMMMWTGMSNPPILAAKGLGLATEPAITGVLTVQQPVSGTVPDETGAPLPGATVRIKGTVRGTVTDLDGRCTIEVGEDAVLQISYVGYMLQEISVGGQAVISVQLE